MKEIWKYLCLNKKETILAPIFKMLEACFELFIPLLVADIIDVGVGNGDFSYIVRRGTLMIVFGIVGFGLAVTAQYFAAKSAIGVSSAMRADLFYHISSLSYSKLDSIGTSALVTGMTSDINQVQNGVNWSLRLFMRSPFIVFGAAIMSCTISPSASVIFWCTIGVLIFVIFIIMKLTMPMNMSVQERLEKVTRSFRENLSGVRVVRAFNNQRIEREQFDSAHGSLYESQIKAGKVSSLLNPLTFAIINLAIVLLLYSGAVSVQIGNMSQGQVIALFNYMSQILVELIKFANVVLMLSKAIACFKRVQAVLRAPSGVHEGTEIFECDHAASVSLRGVSFSYGKGGRPAIDNITCEIPQGSKVGIIGATGSGKTTLVNLIAGYYPRSSGQLLLNGIPIDNYTVLSLAEGISVAPQKAVLFKGTVRSNIKWGDKDATDVECLDALTASCAIDFIKEKGAGLDLMVAQNGRNFSGGQRQRLAIARALIKKSGILILDDSYSALDYKTESVIKKTVLRDKADCTVFTVSQRVSSIYGSDFIMVLDGGRLCGCGTHEELIASCPVYGEICSSQGFDERGGRSEGGQA